MSVFIKQSSTQQRQRAKNKIRPSSAQTGGRVLFPWWLEFTIPLKAFFKIPLVFGHVRKWRGADGKKTDGGLFSQWIQFLLFPNNGNSSNLTMPSKRDRVWNPWILGRLKRRTKWLRLTSGAEEENLTSLSRHQSPRQLRHLVPKHRRGVLHRSDHDRGWGGAGDHGGWHGGRVRTKMPENWKNAAAGSGLGQAGRLPSLNAQ